MFTWDAGVLNIFLLQTKGLLGFFLPPKKRIVISWEQRSRRFDARELRHLANIPRWVDRVMGSRNHQSQCRVHKQLSQTLGSLQRLFFERQGKAITTKEALVKLRVDPTTFKRLMSVPLRHFFVFLQTCWKSHLDSAGAPECITVHGEDQSIRKSIVYIHDRDSSRPGSSRKAHLL